jgi:hypothetical protein
MKMKNNDWAGNENRQGLNDADLDRELDTALAKFATVEPRAGLEERILANLLIERQRAAVHSWWRWPEVTALAAVIVIAVFTAWKPEKPKQDVARQHPPTATQSSEHGGPQVVTNSEDSSIRLHQRPGRRPKPNAFDESAVVASAPKLDQFPSPQPLSVQERMLTDYVAEHHQQAVLIAQARMVELKQDLAEEMELASATSNRQAPDQFVSQQKDR